MTALLSAACVVQTSIDDPDPVTPPAPVVRIDRDGDGFTEAEGDCDDEDDRVGPAVAFVEVCDLIDNDCDDVVDNDGVCTVRDSFDQTMRLDVLFVVDTTEGMEPYLRDAGLAAADFAEHVIGPGLDTRMGVITMAFDKPDDPGTAAEGLAESYSGPRNGELVVVGPQAWLEGSMATKEQAAMWLRRAIGDHEPHPGPPRARDAVLAMLGPVGEASDNTYLRTATPMVMVFLSRQEDASEIEVVDFRSELRERFSAFPTLHAVVRLGDGPCAGDTVGSFGASYATLADLSNGVTLDVCSADYAPFFFVTSQLAADQGLGRHYALDHQANLAQPVRVQVVGPAGFVEELEASDYDVVDEGYTLVLQVPPSAGSEVIIDYHRLPAVE